MAKRNRDEEGKEMMETRREAERFVMQHAELLKSATKEEIKVAIGKIGKAVWDLKLASRSGK